MMSVPKFLMVMVLAATAGIAVAVPPGRNVEFAGGPIGKVVFDGKTHADKGLKCNDCHTKIFKMKKGADKITMDAINKGQFCGTCHNGSKAFASNDPKSCTSCHKK